ncbi:hypothetical protein WJX74_005952 [Apatococcus lobatus]|uniref:Uncharacterized protein n=1 Tax=Apatococcus lobatus TaxID=904363 RepID=A0AAW1SE08_9CHLO
MNRPKSQMQPRSALEGNQQDLQPLPLTIKPQQRHIQQPQPALEGNQQDLQPLPMTMKPQQQHTQQQSDPVQTDHSQGRPVLLDHQLSIPDPRHPNLEPLPMWDEFSPVPILRLKAALLGCQLDLEVSLKQLNLRVPLRVLMSDKLPGLIQRSLEHLRKIAPRCHDISTSDALTREVLSTTGDAMCMLIVLGDTRTHAMLSAEGFHGQDAGRPAPPGLISQAMAACRLTPVQVAHTRLLHWKHSRQADEAMQMSEGLSKSLAAAFSQQLVMGKRAGFASRCAHLRRVMDECIQLEEERYMQMQQAFCLQVLSPFQAAQMFAAAGPYNLDIGHMVDLINTSHPGPLA